MHKCAIIGVAGYRANGHAEAYRLIRRGRLVAVSTRRADKLNAFVAKHGVPAGYTDYREMFERERPDLVHVNTPPTVRAEVIEAAEQAGVPMLLVEKPIAIQAEDYAALRALAARVKVKVAINHQLHFHPNRAALQRRVAAGEIGQVRLIDASARLNMAAQGTHMLQAIGAFNPAPAPGKSPAARQVLAQCAGGDGLRPSPREHYAPDNTLASITYDNGVRAFLQCGPASPEVKGDDASAPYHKRISVHGSAGAAHWTMWGWSLTDAAGKTTGGSHNYFEQDVAAQAAMTEAMFDWHEHPGSAAHLHPLNLHAALDDMLITLAVYTSALERRVVDLPFDPPADLLNKLRQAL